MEKTIQGAEPGKTSRFALPVSGKTLQPPLERLIGHGKRLGRLAEPFAFLQVRLKDRAHPILGISLTRMKKIRKPGKSPPRMLAVVTLYP